MDVTTTVDNDSTLRSTDPLLIEEIPQNADVPVTGKRTDSGPENKLKLKEFSRKI